MFPLPPVALLVSHRVADYDAWKQVFDGHARARAAAGVLGHDVNCDVDDPNLLHIYVPGDDVEKIVAFIESADLKDVMKAAGVVSEPTVIVLKPIAAKFIPDEMLPGIIVRHAVEDYERWQDAYDDFEDARKAAGIVGHAVSQVRGESNHLVVYHQARELDTLHAFVDSRELKVAMMDAGVIGAPEISFIQTVDISEY